MKLFFGLYLGIFTVTSYRAVKNQTDSTPYNTSTTEHVRAGGCAISRDLLCPACRRLHKRCQHPEIKGRIHYGDWLYVDRYEFRQVNDVMGDRVHYRIKTKNGKKLLFKTIRQALDIFVETKKEEHSVNIQKLNVYKIYE